MYEEIEELKQAEQEEENYTTPWLEHRDAINAYVASPQNQVQQAVKQAIATQNPLYLSDLYKRFEQAGEVLFVCVGNLYLALSLDAPWVVETDTTLQDAAKNALELYQAYFTRMQEIEAYEKHHNEDAYTHMLPAIPSNVEDQHSWTFASLPKTYCVLNTALTHSAAYNAACAKKCASDRMNLPEVLKNMVLNYAHFPSFVDVSTLGRNIANAHLERRLMHAYPDAASLAFFVRVLEKNKEDINAIEYILRAYKFFMQKNPNLECDQFEELYDAQLSWCNMLSDICALKIEKPEEADNLIHLLLLLQFYYPKDINEHERYKVLWSTILSNKRGWSNYKIMEYVNLKEALMECLNAIKGYEQDLENFFKYLAPSLPNIAGADTKPGLLCTRTLEAFLDLDKVGTCLEPAIARQEFESRNFKEHMQEGRRLLYLVQCAAFHVSNPAQHSDYILIREKLSGQKEILSRLLKKDEENISDLKEEGEGIESISVINEQEIIAFLEKIGRYENDLQINDGLIQIGNALVEEIARFLTEKGIKPAAPAPSFSFLQTPQAQSSTSSANAAAPQR